MDRLETRLKPETGDTIWLKYQNFLRHDSRKDPRVMNWFFNWLDDRTGYRHLISETLDEPVPGVRQMALRLGQHTGLCLCSAIHHRFVPVVCI